MRLRQALAWAVRRFWPIPCPGCGRLGYDPSLRVWFHPGDPSCSICGRKY